MDTQGLPIQRAVVAMGGVLFAITTLLPWMTVTVHVSVARSSIANPYIVAPPGGPGVSVVMFSFTKGWILVPIVVLGAGLVGGGAALAGPLRKVGIFGAIMVIVVLVAEGIGYYHLHSAGSSVSFASGVGRATSSSSVSLTPAVGGWITIVAIVALLAWAVMSGSSRRTAPSGSHTRAMDLPVATFVPGIGLDPSEGSVVGVDPVDVPLPSFAAGPQPVVPASLPAGWYPDETDAAKQGITTARLGPNTLLRAECAGPHRIDSGDAVGIPGRIEHRFMNWCF